jgi:PAS domain-containing protein
MPSISHRPEGHPGESQLGTCGQRAQIVRRLRSAIVEFQKSRLLDEGQGELQRQKQELQSFGYAAADALLVILDSGGRVVWINRACEKLTGYASKELEGTPLNQTPPASDESDA